MEKSYDELKITDIEILENNVKSAPDTLSAQGDTTTREIKNIFDRLPELLAARFNSLVDYITGNLEYYAKAILEQQAEKLGGGDMLKSVYDTDGDGIVDNAKQLDGHGAEYFAAAEETVKKTGAAMTGMLVLAADPAESMHAATKQYVDGRITLLWSNPSPADDFAAQEVAVNLEGYAFVMVLAITGTTVTTEYLQPYITPNITGNSCRILQGFQGSTSVLTRDFVITENGISFEDNLRANALSNAHNIPALIYGIR